jgi:hypothetical protein
VSGGCRSDRVTLCRRVAGSLLVNSGLPLLLTFSARDFEDTAVRLATSASHALSAMRRALQACLVRVPFSDSGSFAGGWLTCLHCCVGCSG